MNIRSFGAACLVGASALLPLSQAHAEAIASSVIEFTDFRIYGSQGGALTQLDVSDFDALDFASTADADATLNGVTEAITLAIDTGSNGIDFPNVYPPGTDVDPAGNDLCVGDCGGALVGIANNNGYPQIREADVTGAGLGSYAWADQLEIGSPITGLLDSNNNAVASDADVGNGSYGHVSGGGQAGSNSDNGLISEFSFDLMEDQDFLEVEFTVDALAYAFMGAGDSGLASARTFYSLRIAGVTWCIYVGMTDTCALGLPAESILSGTHLASIINGGAVGASDETTESRTIRAFTVQSFAATDTYLLTGATETSVEVRLVPVPGTLALLGLGLVGFSVMRRKTA